MELTCATVVLPPTLDPASVAALTRALDEALASPAPVVALTGAGPDLFCAGLAIDAATEGRDAMTAFATLLTTLHMAPKPLLAIVDGTAIGGGLGLACACDWVVATSRSTFALPELLWGLVPAIIWPVVTDRMAPHVARHWTVSAYSRDAATAAAAGVVDEVVDAAHLSAGRARGVRALMRLEPNALRCLRAWSRESRLLPLPDALHRGAAITTGLAGQPAVRARWRAFTDGEAPWSA